MKFIVLLLDTIGLMCTFYISSFSSYYILGAVIAMLMAIIVHFAEKEALEVLEEKSISQHVYEDPGVFIDGIFYGSTLFLAVYLSSGLQ
ncbi:MAG: hypothetical protein L0K75_10175, partial [Enterococcaceae bacterium]|nr:hypothetical protein [Enterococcaceae bacterium]